MPECCYIQYETFSEECLNMCGMSPIWTQSAPNNWCSLRCATRKVNTWHGLRAIANLLGNFV